MSSGFLATGTQGGVKTQAGHTHTHNNDRSIGPIQMSRARLSVKHQYTYAVSHYGARRAAEMEITL